MTALDRYGNESAPIYESTAALVLHPSSVLLPTDGKTLDVPRLPFDAKILQLCDMQGRVVSTTVNRPQINIRRLTDGMYMLKSVNKKGVTHRLGYFIIKR